MRRVRKALALAALQLPLQVQPGPVRCGLLGFGELGDGAGRVAVVEQRLAPALPQVCEPGSVLQALGEHRGGALVVAVTQTQPTPIVVGARPVEQAREFAELPIRPSDVAADLF